MSNCNLNPYQLSTDINSMYEIKSASKTLEMDFGGISSELTFDMPKDIDFNNENINNELTHITEYINNDINEYLTCLATKSEAEIITSLKSSVSHFTDLFKMIPKINNLIPNIEKLKTFIPENQDIDETINSIIESVKVIDKYASTLITLLIIILSALILILSMSTLILISLFIKQTSSIYIILIILIYTIITLIIGYTVKNYIEDEMNLAITSKLETLKHDIDSVVNEIRSNA